MKYAEIKHLQEPELRKRLNQTRQALFDSRMKHKMQRLSNMMDLRNLKRNKARLETALSVMVPVPSTDKRPKELTGQKVLSQAVPKPVPVQKPTKPWAEKEKQARKERAKERQAQIAQRATTLQAESTAEKKTQKPARTELQKKIGKWFGLLISAQKAKKPKGKRSFFRKKSN